MSASFASSLLAVVGEESGTFWDYSVPVSVAGYVGNALLLQDLVGYWQVSVPFWSIAVEVQIYLLFPLLLLCWRKLGARRTVFYAVVLSYVTDLLVEFVAESVASGELTHLLGKPLARATAREVAPRALSPRRPRLTASRGCRRASGSGSTRSAPR